MRVTAAGSRMAVRLDQSPPENSCRPAVDVLFHSVSQAFGGQALGVILTGMGQDGLRGSEALKAAGACILAQDEQTSVVWGMPRAVTQAGLVHAVVPLSQMAAEITDRTRRRPQSRGPAQDPGTRGQGL